jgi:hypothetical protein
MQFDKLVARKPLLDLRLIFCALRLYCIGDPVDGHVPTRGENSHQESRMGTVLGPLAGANIPN